MTEVDLLVRGYLDRLDRAAAALPPERRSELLSEIGEHIASARAQGASGEAAVRTVLDRLGTPEEIVTAAREDVPAPVGGYADPYGGRHAAGQPSGDGGYGGGWASGGGHHPGWTGAAPQTVPRQPGTGLELAAVLLLTAGSLVPVVGWLVGVVLLWVSTRWRVREKLLGTLVVPLGPGAVLYAGALFVSPLSGSTTCSGGTTYELPGPVLEPPAPPGLPAPAGPPAPPGAPAAPPPELPLVPAPGDFGEAMSCVSSGPPGWVGPIAMVVLVVAPVLVAVLLLRLARRRAALEEPVLVPAAGGPSAAPWGPLELAGVLVLGLGGLLVPVIGSVIGLVLVCCSPRWSVGEKLAAATLWLLGALTAAVALGLVVPGVDLLLSRTGSDGLLLPYASSLLGAALAAVLLTVTLSSRR